MLYKGAMSGYYLDLKRREKSFKENSFVSFIKHEDNWRSFKKNNFVRVLFIEKSIVRKLSGWLKKRKRKTGMKEKERVGCVKKTWELLMNKGEDWEINVHLKTTETL